MGIPAYAAAGDGAATDTNGGALNVPYPAGISAGHLLLAHIYYDGSAAAPSTPAGWTEMGGPYNVHDDTPSSRHWLYGKIAAGTESGTESFGTVAATTLRMGRMYRFTGVASATLAECYEDLDGAEFGYSADVTDNSVTTSGANRLALNLVAWDDDNVTPAVFDGESGGNWVEAVGDYESALAGDGTIYLMYAEMASAGTIDGGSCTTTLDGWGVIGLALIGTADAGGTTYNESCADGVALDESAAPTACIFGVSAADGVGVDELTGGTAIMPSAAADGVETQDAATSLAELLAAAADSVTVSDGASTIATFLRAAADSVALQDLATTIATFLVQAADGVTVDDAASVAALGVIEVLAADGVAVDDSAAAVASLQVTCTDSVTVDDLTTATFRIVAVSADGVEVNDAVTVVVTMAAAAADSVSVQDAATTLCTFLVQALDGVALQDVAVSTSGALASGRVTVTFSTKRGSVSITAKRAAVTITPKVPKLTLS